MAFADKVYNLCRKIPKGKVTTYKELARALGTKAYRAVGQAMRHNPYAPAVPCHRVVSSDGTLGGFGGKTQGPNIARKIKMLEKEGVQVKGRRIQNFSRVLHRF